jgi:hypothetical protein
MFKLIAIINGVNGSENKIIKVGRKDELVPLMNKLSSYYLGRYNAALAVVGCRYHDVVKFIGNLSSLFEVNI